MPAGTRGIIRKGSWPVPPVFGWIQRLGDVDDAEMHQVFNMGVGLVLVVARHFAPSIERQVQDLGLATWPIGEVIAGEPGVAWESP
jgi:phosphoribosylformylglycinamidine cyclo-ligase